MAPTTITGWVGTRTVTLGTSVTRSVTVTPSLGREFRLQRWNGSGWSNLTTLKAGSTKTSTVVVTIPKATTPSTSRYRLAVPPSATGARLLTGELKVTTTKIPTSISGWPTGSSNVTWGTAGSRTVKIQSGRAVTLQRYSSGAWRDVRGYVVPISGELRITSPTVWTTTRSYYRIKVSATSTREGATSGTWTIRPVAPPMPAQRYNGEVRAAVGTWAGYTNGAIPTSILCSPSWASSGHRTRCDADLALEKMNKAYRAKFGANMSITSTYRTYAQQVALKIQKPTLAAKPGTSNHGWGLAVDFGGGVQTWGSAQHKWMRANANTYGWYHPSWAQFDGSKPEAWHWEYAGAAASGSATQARALGMELVRTQSWNSYYQRRCTNDLWTAKSGWSYTASKSGGDRRGIPQLSMKATFGSSWTTSAAAREYLRNPQAQIEYGLRDITRRSGTACKALKELRATYPGSPKIVATVTNAAAVTATKPATLAVRYEKAGVPVAKASLTLQHLRSGVWVNVKTLPVVDGVVAGQITSKMGAGTYRIRNYNASTVSHSFKVSLAS